MKRNLQSVAQFAASGPFTQNQLRWWIFQGEHNGLAAAGAIVRLQRRVYIDIDRFSDWIESQQPATAEAA